MRSTPTESKMSCIDTDANMHETTFTLKRAPKPKDNWQRLLRAAKMAHRRGLEDIALYLYRTGLQLADERHVEREIVTNYLRNELWSHSAKAS